MKTRQSLIVALILAAFLFSQTSEAQDQKPPTQPSATGGGARAEDPTFRVVKSISGTKVSEQGGRYIVEDPRTAFYVPADKEIVVYFTWEGPAGAHHFEGLWKKPDGKVAMTSEFDYKPEQPRFGGYFKMLLGDSPATGVWTLEARIDGETAGSHTFQITLAPRPDGISATTARRVVAPSELYNRAAAASVPIENLNQKGSRRSVGTGFFIAPGKLLTAFQVIDGATKVRLVVAPGKFLDVSEVLAWNRREDWVILKVAMDNVKTLERAPANSITVGDRCYFLDAPSDTSRVIVETSIVGKQNLGAGGERLNIGDTPSARAAGSPVLNEYAEVVGLIGGSLIPGAAFLDNMVYSSRTLSLSPSRGSLAVPIELVKETAATPATIDTLASSGQFMPPLVGDSVLSGVLSRSINKKIDPPESVEPKSEFSRNDNQGVLLVTWMAPEKRKGKPSLRLYDMDNHLLSEMENKKKITVNPHKLSYSAWDLNFATLPAGVFRLDVALEGAIVWRTFFRMVE
jgi:hypothetical protein